MIREKTGRSPTRQNNAVSEIEIGDNFAAFLEKMLNQMDFQNEIREQLQNIMSAQSDFDEKVSRLETAVLAETKQVADWIAANPNLDTSKLDTMVANIENIFTAAVEPADPATDADGNPIP